MTSVDNAHKATSGNSGSKNKKKSGEPHRIYWQQWIANNNNSITSQPFDAQQQPQEQRLSRRELITSSAAVRLSRSAKAADLTDLLRKTLKLPEPSEQVNSASAALDNNKSIGATPMMDGAQDCLVLVGTLYSLPRDYVQYEHELNSPGDTVGSIYRSSSVGGDPFHVVRTLSSSESPLVARDQMEQYLKRFLQRAVEDNDYVPITSSPLTSSVSMDLSTRTVPPLPTMMRATTTTTTSSSSLGSTSRTTIAPKLQWYYVPAAVVSEGNAATGNNNKGTLIPNCVELDGYCTAMEDDNDNNGSENDDDDDSSSNGSSVATESTLGCFSSRRGEPLSRDDEDTHLLVTKFPWLVDNASSPDTVRKSDDRAVQQKLARENRLYEELSTSETTPSQRVSGYLLKRDSRDKNVWRSVYCVLTDDHLWYVSRIYTRRTTTTTSKPYRYAKHGRIKLTRALLLEPTADYAPLYRTPYAFEVVSAKGTSHIFRASSKQLQSKWILSLSERIVQSYESSLLEQAELIMADEYLARNRRTTALAVGPLWDAAVRVSNEHFDAGLDSSTVTENVVSATAPSIGNSIGSVLRWGMEVAEFRDRCRFILSSMPAKTPVVAATTPQRRRFFTSRDPSQRQASTSELAPPEPLSSFTQEMIRASWDQASALLSRATSLALTFHVRSSLRHDHDDEPAKLSHAVDTLCRHVEYVITGSFRHGKEHSTTIPPAPATPPPPLPASANAVPSPSAAAVRQVSTGSSSADTINHHHIEDGPPPADLFDHLLTEMQLLAAAADRRVHREVSETVPSLRVTTT